MKTDLHDNTYEGTLVLNSAIDYSIQLRGILQPTLCVVTGSFQL